MEQMAKLLASHGLTPNDLTNVTSERIRGDAEAIPPVSVYAIDRCDDGELVKEVQSGLTVDGGESHSEYLHAQMKPLQSDSRTILGGKAELRYLGKEHGDFKPSGPNFWAMVELLRRQLGITMFFAPKLGFTKATASLRDRRVSLQNLTATGLIPLKEHHGIVRTEDKADGGLILFKELPEWLEPQEVAMAAFNADCPFIMGTTPEAMFMLHAGLGCLHANGQTDKRTIFRTMIETHNLDPSKMNIYVCAGIQHCCYGHSNGFTEVAKIWGEDLLHVATKGPRAGQPSLDLSEMIHRDLIECGVPEANIEIDRHCTSCDGNYWSNVVGPDKLSRNALAFRLRK